MSAKKFRTFDSLFSTSFPIGNSSKIDKKSTYKASRKCFENESISKNLFNVKNLNLRLFLATICANYCKLENYKSVEIFNLTFVGIGPKPADGGLVLELGPGLYKSCKFITVLTIGFKTF